MKRVSKKFQPKGCNYKYMFKTYYEQPKGTVVMYYLRDDDNNYTAVCRHKLYLRSILLLATIIFCAYKINNTDGVYGKVYVPKVVTVRDDFMSLDLKYHEDSNASCLYYLYMDNKCLITGELQPGQSIGNVSIPENDIVDGDYPGEFVLKIEGSNGKTDTNTKSVLIKVRKKVNNDN